MTAELFQNLISNLSSAFSPQSQQTSAQTQDTEITNEFTKAFDNAKSKYVSKDTQNETRKITSDNANNTSLQNQKEKYYTKTTANDKSAQKSELVTPKNNEENSKLKSESITTDENNIIENAPLIEKNTEEIAADIKNLHNNFLCELIAVTTGDETSDNTEKLANTYVDENMIDTFSETSNSTTQTTLQESILQTEQNIHTNTNLANISLNTTTQNETMTSLEPMSDAQNEIDKTQTVTTESDLTTDIESLENELLVKIDDAIAEIDTEITTKAKNLETTKISQDTINNLDVTIQSAESMGKQNSAPNDGKEFANQNNNAQEDVIKMSIEGLNPDTEIEPTTTTTTGSTIDTTNIAQSTKPNVTITNFEKTPAPTTITQQKDISSSDILNQITGKITLPQDNATSKVNIILQPENLGKVSVEILQTKDGVIAKMLAETPQVKELLDKSIESLKNNIASLGVNVNSISVKVEESASSQNTNFEFGQQQFNKETENHSNDSNKQQEQNQSTKEFTENEHRISETTDLNNKENSTNIEKENLVLSGSSISITV